MEPRPGFETPENVRVYYEQGGLGKRFLAWLVDEILVFLFVFALSIVLLIAVAAGSRVIEGMVRLDPEEMQQMPLYLFGVVYLVVSLGGFVYFGLSELLMRGQTFGKRRNRLRVVRLDGFTLSAGAVFVRNIFRIVDHLPPLWLIPLLSRHSQRLGDLVAGTVVVEEPDQRLSPLRRHLSAQDPAEAKHVFPSAKLAAVTSADIKAIEGLIGRWRSLDGNRRKELGARIVTALCSRLGVAPPEEPDTFRFLGDLLAAKIRHDERELG